MRRAVKVGLIALPWSLLALLIWDDLRRIDFFAIDASTAAHSAARSAFFADLAYDGCVGPDAVIAQAEARDWFWEVMEDPLHWCHTPTGLSGWIHVEVSPALPFSTESENAAYIGFDEAGCMARWDYASGEGSTCAEN